MAVENDLAQLKRIGPKHAAMLKEHRRRLAQGAAPPQRCQPHGDDRDPARRKVAGLSDKKTVQGWIDAAKSHE
jgi:hypothetical protein